MNFETDYVMTVNGKQVVAADSMPVINPATGEAFAEAPVAGSEQLDAAVEAARAAYPGWRRLPLADRAAALTAASKIIFDNADALARLFVREQGRPLNLAKGEIQAAAFWLRQVSKQDIPVEVTEDSDARRIEVHHEPLGVVCAIVPWNFPVLLASWKIAPALLTGNTMVLKPSPYTPLCTLKIAELIQGMLPPGVLNVISGRDALGPMMTAHPGFAKITFTGSTATGKRVMEAASRDLKRITLELGGNDAAIVLPDVDVDAVAQEIFFGSFYNTAQVCVATKRLYVHEVIYDQLRDRLHDLARNAKLRDGLEQDSMFGPIQNEPQYHRVLDLLDDARRSGLTVLEGGAVPDKGYFVPLTIIDNPPETSRVVQEEAFGPILPMMRFSDIDEVIRRANDTVYGLAGAVWSEDIDQAIAIAHRLETGTVWINQNLQNTPATPLAGHKQSGIGVENGTAGLMEFTQPKAIFIPKRPKDGDVG